MFIRTLDKLLCSLCCHFLYSLFCGCHSDRSTPSLHEMGHFIIPTMCDPVQLQNFLQSHAQEARRRIQRKDQWVLLWLVHTYKNNKWTVILVSYTGINVQVRWSINRVIQWLLSSRFSWSLCNLFWDSLEWEQVKHLKKNLVHVQNWYIKHVYDAMTQHIASHYVDCMTCIIVSVKYFWKFLKRCLNWYIFCSIFCFFL